MNDKATFCLIAIPIVGIAIAIGFSIKKDINLTQLCLANGYSDQRRTNDDMYCIKRGVYGETIVTNAKDLK